VRREERACLRCEQRRYACLFAIWPDTVYADIFVMIGCIRRSLNDFFFRLCRRRDVLSPLISPPASKLRSMRAAMVTAGQRRCAAAAGSCRADFRQLRRHAAMPRRLVFFSQAVIARAASIAAISPPPPLH